MKAADMLLLAPVLVCMAGAAAYVLTDMPLSRLCLLVGGLSIAAIVLHWVISRVR